MDVNKFIYGVARPIDAWLTRRRGGTMLSDGDKAPGFTVKNHLGNTVSLDDFKGKSVVLWFFPKADTPG
jgi:peroxiredoxin